ncbi:MAG: hypothetical protein J7L16_06710, partial [Deltaproteobacteria bacterium]|nr:hypothetical protein [Deltaproteobacteria bacterium]
MSHNFNAPEETQKRRLKKLLERIEELNIVLIQIRPKSCKRRVCRRPACCRQVQGGKGADVLR